VRIFTLAILSSSHFIYNSKSTIDSTALEKLSMCVQLANELKGKSGKLRKEEYAELFPSFSWLVRDFNLELKDENG